MNKLYRRCTMMIKRMIAEFEHANLSVTEHKDVIAYSTAYEHSVSFKTAERIMKHVLTN